MTRKFWLCSAVCVVALAVACARQSANPISPSAIGAANLGAAADGTTLKATAPVAVSPVSGVQIGQSEQPTLVVSNSTLAYSGNNSILTYKFVVFNAAGVAVYTSPLVASGTGGTTSHTVTAALDPEQTYSWYARAEYSGTFGAWSSRSNSSFVMPANSGFIKGNEMYDPLIAGKTVGTPSGPIQWIPNVGVKLLALESYIAYELPETLFEGEFSLLVTDMPANTKGGKTKLFAMGQGYSDIVTNEYRATIEKRGDPPGIIAWRFIARDDQIDTEGAEREEYNFQANLTYFWQATWKANRFDLIIREGGFNGRQIYAKGKDWEGRGYEPKPHVLYLGAPVGRSGPDGASVQGVTIRQVYVGPFRRPAGANQ
jgi:hypothetical protein